MKLRNKIMMSVSMLLAGLMLVAVNPTTASAKPWTEVVEKAGVYTFKKADATKYRVTVNGDKYVSYVATLEKQVARINAALTGHEVTTSFNFGKTVKLYINGPKGAGSFRTPLSTRKFVYSYNAEKGKTYLKFRGDSAARMVVRSTETGARLYANIAAKQDSMIAMVSTKGDAVKMFCQNVPGVELTAVEAK